MSQFGKWEKELEDKCKDWGASFIGLSNVSDFVDSKYKELGNCLTIGVRLSDFIINQIENEPTYTYFHHYRTVNFLLDQIALKASLKIMEKGYKALAVGASQTVNDVQLPYSGVFQHKTGATRAGLGFIGKSALFISNEYGPKVRLVSVLTDMPIEYSSDVQGSSCGECTNCVDSCPAKAISGVEWTAGITRDKIFDAKCCSEFMSKKFKHIGRGSVCGICIKVCPFGK